MGVVVCGCLKKSCIVSMTPAAASSASILHTDLVLSLMLLWSLAVRILTVLSSTQSWKEGHPVWTAWAKLHSYTDVVIGLLFFMLSFVADCLKKDFCVCVVSFAINCRLWELVSSSLFVLPILVISFIMPSSFPFPFFNSHNLLWCCFSHSYPQIRTEYWNSSAVSDTSCSCGFYNQFCGFYNQFCGFL